MDISFRKPSCPFVGHREIEIVERKGLGHPDTLADSIADAISYKYSNYCLEKFGYILHHNVDKTSLLGGESRAGFGYGTLIRPVRVIINGRMSDAFGGEKIPIFKIASETAKKYFSKAVPTINPEQDVVFFDFLNRAGGAPHKGQKWFRPLSKKDLPEVKNPCANDTICATGFWPYSKIEKLTLKIESLFYEDLFKPKFEHIGFDIKTMVVRIGKTVSITLCIPFIGEKTPSLAFYREKLKKIKKMVKSYAENFLNKDFIVTVDLNTRDNEIENDLFILARGTALESGDEGIVGRGNRSNGFISSMRPYSMEAPYGKNPTYFAGKVYDFFANKLAQKISEALSLPVTVYIVTQNGTPLRTPSNLIIELSKTNKKSIDIASRIIEEQLSRIHNISGLIIQNQKTTYNFLDSLEL